MLRRRLWLSTSVSEPADLPDALAQLAESRASEAALRAQLTELTRAVTRLTEQVALLLARRAKKAKAPVPAAPGPSADESVPADGLPARPQPPTIPEKPDKVVLPVRPSGRRPIPEHLGVDAESHRPSMCVHCGGKDLRIVGEEITNQIDTIREHLRRREITRKRCLCNECHKTTLAEMPAMPWERAKVTSNMAAHVVYQKMGLHVPLDRMRRDFELRGVHFAISTLVSIMSQAGGLLAAIDGVHWKQLVAGDWMNADGSGIDVVVNKGGVARGIIDVFTRDDIAVYTFSVSKNGKDFAGRLSKFEGTLVADAESRMNETFVTGLITEAGCNSHGIRKFDGAESEQPVLAVEGRQFVAAMFYWEDQAQERRLVGAELLAWRQEHIAPVSQDFRRWIDAVRCCLLPGTPLYKALNYYVNHWDALMRFLGDPKIPMHNNAAERLFRALDSGRHNWLFAGNEDSAHNLAALMGLVSTCRLQSIDPQNYLAWALERRGTWRKKFNLDPEQLTPAAYKRWMDAGVAR